MVENIRHSLALSESECFADHLAACGLGAQITADSVAACSRRFAQHAEQQALPKVVVLLGRRVLGLAIQAGLVDDSGSTWQPLGVSAPAKVVFIEDIHGLKKGIQRVAQLLGKPFMLGARENRALLGARAAVLLGVLGEHSGHGVLKLGSSKWRRLKRPALNVGLVSQHLAGKRYVAPFHPNGPWPFVVLDVDRHNALQESVFGDTMKTLQKLFPGSLAVRSSPSGGVHLYVRLPPGVNYADGALTLRAFVTLRGCRWRDAGPANRHVRTEIVEVPDQPARLPFGYGSGLYRSKKPLHEQLDEFIAFVADANHRDYDRAKQHVDKQLKLGARSMSSRRRVIADRLLEEEVRGLSPAPLDATDPWKSVLERLPRPLRVIAASGIPAYGTRHRWTHALAQALADLVPPDEVRTLMMHWLNNREHISEDIETDPISAERQTSEIIDAIYKKLRGIPEKYWTTIREHISMEYTVLTRPFRPGSFEHAQIMSWLRSRRQTVDGQRRWRIKWPLTFRLADALETAFFIVRRFFELGRRERGVSHREFARVVGKNDARMMRLVVVGSQGWLWQTAFYEPGRHSRRFKLQAAWPPRPGPRLFCPPR